MNLFSMIIEVIATAFGAICLYSLIVCYPKYENMLENLNDEDFTLKESYCIGLALADRLKFQYDGKWHSRERTYLSILWPPKYTEYYLRITDAKRISLTLIVATIVFSLAGVSGEKGPVFFLFGIVASAAVYVNYSDQNKKRVTARADEMLNDLPEVASRLALLMNAGMMLREAWTTVSMSGEGKMFQEMRIVNHRIENGMSETAAIYEFGRNSESDEIRKFCSHITQSMTKSGAQLASELSRQSEELWELKRQLVLRKADANAQKLLAPLLVMFIGILILVVVPILSNMM